MQYLFSLFLFYVTLVSLNAQNPPPNYIELKQRIVQPNVGWIQQYEKPRVHPSPIIVGVLSGAGVGIHVGIIGSFMACNDYDEHRKNCRNDILLKTGLIGAGIGLGSGLLVYAIRHAIADRPKKRRFEGFD